MQIDSPSNSLVHNSFALGGELALIPSSSRPLLSRISTKVNGESSGHARESRRNYPSFGMAAEAIEIENNGYRPDEDPFKSASAPESSSAFPVEAVNTQPVLDGGLSSSPAHAFLSMLSSPSAASKHLVEDTVVAGYTLLQTIGYGGFSTVLKGASPNGEVVAVKRVKKVDIERQDDPDECRRQLYNEMEIWRTLNHEHILPLFAVDRTEDADYFVTLFCPAGSLFDILKRDGRPALAQDDAGMLFRQVVRGLRYLHDTAKIVHGDIKLENILVDEAGTCRIADFGLSRRFSDASSPQSEEDCHCQHERGVDHAVERLRRYTTISHRPRYSRSRRPSRHRNSAPLNNGSDTPPGLPCHHFHPGSLEYAAPELLAPPQLHCPIHTCSNSVNPAQDMWALGVLLYALLTGHLPFSDSFEPRLQMKILHGAYEPPLDIGHGAKSVLRGCLERVVSDRWTIDMVDDVAWGVGWGSAGDVSTETISHTPSECIQRCNQACQLDELQSDDVPTLVKSTLANIPGPPAKSWWKGSFHQVFNKNGWKFHHDIVERYGSVVKLRMLFGDEQPYVSDPLALHHITVKDQYIYEETSMFIASNALFFGKSLLSTLGEHHRKQRKMLNPVFSLKHMRDLLPIFYPMGYDLRDVLKQQVVGNEAKEVDVLDWVHRAALEYIGQGGMGYSFNALHDEKATRYCKMVKALGPLLFKTLPHRQFLPWVVHIGSPKFCRKVVEMIPSQLVKSVLGIVDSLDSQSRLVYQEKKSALEKGDEVLKRQVGMGKDILSVLLRANTTVNGSERLPKDELIGQLNTFILAGQDTSSHAISQILHQLALNSDVQDRLRNEIVAARKERGGTELDYDTLMGLPYLDAVCRETLRVYPPVSMVSRTTRKDIVMPLAWPILGKDRKTQITEIPTKKNTNAIISIIAANRSKKIWGEDAEEWKPERWLKPLPEIVSNAHLPGVYSSMMTFIGGGRACIGFKFAEMEIKLVLSILLETFEFSPGPEIEWMMVGVARPIPKGSGNTTASLPLEVTLSTRRKAGTCGDDQFFRN